MLIDAPGSLKRGTLAAIRATKEVLLMATPDMASVSNCMKTSLIAEFLGLTPISLVLNRVREDEFEIGGTRSKWR